MQSEHVPKTRRASLSQVMGEQGRMAWASVRPSHGRAGGPRNGRAWGPRRAHACAQDTQG
eukprot:350428-Chlamydomonas_euryale.AAC.4